MGHVTRIGQVRNTFRILGMKPLVIPEKGDGEITLAQRAYKNRRCMELAQDCAQWWAVKLWDTLTALLVKF